MHSSQYHWTSTVNCWQHSPSKTNNTAGQDFHKEGPLRRQHFQKHCMKYCRDGHLKTNKRCLLCSPDEQTSLEATTSLIIFLYKHGCKITKEKTHVAESKVIFLGHCISQGTKHLTEERKQAISKVSEPRTKSWKKSISGTSGVLQRMDSQCYRTSRPLIWSNQGYNKGTSGIQWRTKKVFP